MFASGGQDNLIAVWDLEQKDKSAGASAAVDEVTGPEAKKARTAGPGAALPPQIMFQHAGHRSEVTFAKHPLCKALRKSFCLPLLDSAPSAYRESRNAPHARQPAAVCCITGVVREQTWHRKTEGL